MNTMVMNNPQHTLLHSNPVLSRLSRVTERTDTGDVASYYGIARKTAYFLLVTLLGIVLQLMASAIFAGEPVWQTISVYEEFTITLSLKESVILAAVTIAGFVCELAGIFIRKTIPVTGTLYAAGQGYLISFLVFHVLKGYEFIGLEALLLTVAVVAVMSWLYASGRVRYCKKYRIVLLTMFVGSMAVGVMSVVGFVIPLTRPYVIAMLQNSGLVIAMDLIGIVIAALFLISDFSMIETCVQEGYPKDFEWAAAFGLVFTVIWIYLKILDLLIQLNGKNKD